MKKMPQEIEEGNVEYKRTVSNLPEDKFHHLLTQMEWRLSEGYGGCVYYLGVDDDGSFYGVSDREQDSSLDALCQSAQESDASIVNIRFIYPGSSDTYIIEVIIKRERKDIVTFWF